MVPTYFVSLEDMPLTVNGKVDVSALPAPAHTRAEAMERPCDAIQERVAALWNEVLHIPLEELSINDRFFEIGGNSLRLMAIISKIHQDFGLRIPLVEVFKAPTIKGISRYIQTQEKTLYKEIKPSEKKQYYPLTSAQRRIYFIQELDRTSTAYNMPRWIKLSEGMDASRVETALIKLVERHESFRTSFVLVDGEPVQCISDGLDFSLPSTKNNDQSIEQIAKDFIKPFDLTRAPLFRACLLQQNNELILLFDAHHIISDGISELILERDFQAIANNQELPPVQLNYRDYSNWQYLAMKAGYFLGQEKYWSDVFSKPVKPLNLPYDYKQQTIQSFRGNALYFTLNQQEFDNVKAIAIQEEVTPYMLLLSIYMILLSKLANQQDVSVGIPIAGRHHAKTENTIGVFINTAALRTQVNSDQQFCHFVKAIKDLLLHTYENQDYPIDLLSRKNEPGNHHGGPLFNVMFDYHNERLDAVAPATGGATKSILKNSTTKFDLNLHLIETSTDTYGSLDYSTDLFEKETVEMILDAYLNLVKEFLRDTQVRIKDIEIYNLLPEESEGIDSIEFDF
jgi:acyl carrier protein